MSGATRPLRVANCSGFYGDRLAAAREAVTGGTIDVLTGDWLAELTMGLLSRQRSRDSQAGYARTFVTQMEDVLAECLGRGIRVVSNAGGLNPEACAAEVSAIAQRLGRQVRVAVVTGDDATGSFTTARHAGWTAPHLDTGEPIPGDPDVVNAYLGGWGIAEALRAGADVVVTGRVTDAAVIVGPVAWHFGWERDNWDALAGAVTAGHIIECGAHATGGNFAFFTELRGLEHVGFPIAEIREDGSSIITKHAGTGGAVTVETVTAQLLYEVDGPRYLNPDVVTRLDTVRLREIGPDRVEVSGVRGEPAPSTVKVGALLHGGFRNEMTFVLTGLDIEAKAEVAQQALWNAIPGGKAAYTEVTPRLLRADRPDPATMTEAVALLTLTVTGKDRALVARFSRSAIEIGLASYPGLHFTGPPGPAAEITVFWPTLMPAADFSQYVTLGDRTWTVPPLATKSPPRENVMPDEPAPMPSPEAGSTRRLPLGTLYGARSGDKAGNVTLGVWARNDAAYAWLRSQWRTQWLVALLPEAAGLSLRLWELPEIRACGVTLVGLLGAGVSANHALDAQGKAIGEYWRAKAVDLPIGLLGQESGHV